MNCRDVQEAADSLSSDELLAETNREIVRHLETCPLCRTETDERRKVQRALKMAFERAPVLRPRAGFGSELREQLRAVATEERPRRVVPGRFFVLAAGVLLAAGLVVGHRWLAPIDTLARDARGDHWNCALKNGAVRMPVPLEEAAERFDRTYRRLITVPPDDMSTPGGPARVVERHSCAFGGRRFGHVILNYRGRVVSLLVTADDDATGALPFVESTPHVHGHPVTGLSVVSVEATRHVILLVGDVEEHELTQLSTFVSVPLARQLEVRTVPFDRTALAMFVGR